MAHKKHLHKKGSPDLDRKHASPPQEGGVFADLFDQHIPHCPDVACDGSSVCTQRGDASCPMRGDASCPMPSDSWQGPPRGPSRQLHRSGSSSDRRRSGTSPRTARWRLQRSDSNNSSSRTLVRGAGEGGEREPWPTSFSARGEREQKDALLELPQEFGDLEFEHLELGDDDHAIVRKPLASAEDFCDEEEMPWSSPFPPPRAETVKQEGVEAGSGAGDDGADTWRILRAPAGDVSGDGDKRGKKRGATPEGKESDDEAREGLPSREKEVRVVRQRTSEVFDVIQDGHHWRKYGQKGVKGRRHPRNYYKCSFEGCGARKQVETNSEGAVMTTYEGTHTHLMPPPLIPSYLMPLLQGLLTGERPNMPASEEEWFQDACSKLGHELKDALEMKKARLKEKDSAAGRAARPGGVPGGNDRRTPAVEK